MGRGCGGLNFEVVPTNPGAWVSLVKGLPNLLASPIQTTESRSKANSQSRTCAINKSSRNMSRELSGWGLGDAWGLNWQTSVEENKAHGNPKCTLFGGPRFLEHAPKTISTSKWKVAPRKKVPFCV